MVMRFEQGRSLEDWLEGLGRSPTQEELDRIVAPILDALQTLHAENFLHRDIAPDNIIVRADGTPVLLDFGAARRAVAEMSRTLTGIVKAGYSPHEQYSVDPACRVLGRTSTRWEARFTVPLPATRRRKLPCGWMRTTCPRPRRRPRVSSGQSSCPPSTPA